jgi:hypothetical protein
MNTEWYATELLYQCFHAGTEENHEKTIPAEIYTMHVRRKIITITA